jgi:pimeloyl-ACP methyl ester carboxylesterase
MMQRWSQRLVDCEFVCLEGAGHIANLEVPDAFNSAVIDFLRRHDA